MDRSWMETIGLLGLDMMFAAVIAMLLAEQVRLLLRRVLARGRRLRRQQGTRSAESAVAGAVRPRANDGIDVNTWPLYVGHHKH